MKVSAFGEAAAALAIASFSSATRLASAISMSRHSERRPSMALASRTLSSVGSPAISSAMRPS